MTYKYLDIGTPPYMDTTKDELRSAFQALLDDQFENSPTYQIIQEEESFSSGSFVDVDVRVNVAISSPTGEKLGDDFKRILFRDISHSTGIGYKYYFDNNFWITVFSENIKNIAASCMVRRCNSRLRWIDDDGNYHEEPCAIDYKIARPRDSVGTTNPVLPQGFVDVYAQLNDKTRFIKPNQRFLFGPKENRVCMKIFGNGIQNTINQETLDDDSGRLVIFSMGGNYVNPETDDIINGIADRYKDYGVQTSASIVGIYNIIISPNSNYILESGSAVYNVKYYLGSNPQSGSFIFSVSGSSVPTNNYIFNTIDGNNFSVVNNQKWLDGTLDILCSGSSGSRMVNINLKGAW